MKQMDVYFIIPHPEMTVNLAKFGNYLIEISLFVPGNRGYQGIIYKI